MFALMETVTMFMTLTKCFMMTMFLRLFERVAMVLMVHRLMNVMFVHVVQVNMVFLKM